MIEIWAVSDIVTLFVRTLYRILGLDIQVDLSGHIPNILNVHGPFRLGGYVKKREKINSL